MTLSVSSPLRPQLGSVSLRDIQRALTGQSTLPSDDAGIGQTLLFAESRRDAIETLTNFDYSAARISFSKASAGGSETLRLASELERRCRERASAVIRRSR